MLAKFAISISMETCKNIANIYITSNNIQMSEETATKDLRTREGNACILDVKCKFSWIDRITRNFKWDHFEKK